MVHIYGMCSLFSRRAFTFFFVLYTGLPSSLILQSTIVSYLHFVLSIIKPLIQPATSSVHTTALHFHETFYICLLPNRVLHNKLILLVWAPKALLHYLIIT